ncbi:MAG: Flp family type IVb pilin [Bdellovibrionales bacterium]|nr:Flp family type IVb pilin [Bdellovibrionales bacterium]
MKRKRTSDTRSQLGAAMVEYTTLGVFVSLMLFTSVDFLGNRVNENAFGAIAGT